MAVNGQILKTRSGHTGCHINVNKTKEALEMILVMIMASWLLSLTEKY